MNHDGGLAEQLDNLELDAEQRESCTTLYRRRSHRFEILSSSSGGNALESEKTSINDCTGSLAFIHVFTVLLCTRNSLTCPICKMLFIDVTVMNCGHAFCKFCVSKYLKTAARCPVCLKIDVHAICNRCYQINSLVESLNAVMLTVLNGESVCPIEESPNNDAAFDTAYGTKLQQGFILLDTFKTEQIRNARRRLLARVNCVVKACPNRSMLQGVSELGFGLRSTISGFILLVTGSVFLALSATQFNDFIEKLELFVLQRCLYVTLIVFMICLKRPFFTRIFQRQTPMFWEQVLKISTTEEYNPSFKFEKTRILASIAKREIDTKKVLLYTSNLYELTRS